VCSGNGTCNATSCPLGRMPYCPAGSTADRLCPAVSGAMRRSPFPAHLAICESCWRASIPAPAAPLPVLAEDLECVGVVTMLVLCFRPAGVILPQHYGGRELLPGQLLPPWIRGVAGAGALVSSFDVLEHLCTCVPVALLDIASTLASFQHRCTCLLSHSLKWCCHSLSVSILAHVFCGAP
jgi:hypothetical protein